MVIAFPPLLLFFRLSSHESHAWHGMAWHDMTALNGAVSSLVPTNQLGRRCWVAQPPKSQACNGATGSKLPHLGATTPPTFPLLTNNCLDPLWLSCAFPAWQIQPKHSVPQSRASSSATSSLFFGSRKHPSSKSQTHQPTSRAATPAGYQAYRI